MIVGMPDGAQVDFGNLPPDQIKGLIASKYPDAIAGGGGTDQLAGGDQPVARPNQFQDLIDKYKQPPPVAVPGPSAGPSVGARPNQFQDLIDKHKLSTNFDQGRFDAASAPPAPTGTPNLQPALDQRVARANDPDNAIGSIVNGMTAGWGDEIAGVFGGVMDAIGGGSYDEGYQRTHDISQSRRTAYADLHPTDAAAGEALGAVATLPISPGLGIIKGPAALNAGARLAPKIINAAGRTAAGVGNAAIGGAAYGAAYGAGSAEPGERLAGAGEGAITGAELGAAGAGAARAIGGVAKVVGSVPYVRRIVQGARGVFQPDAEAARRVVGSVERDTGRPASDAAATMRGLQGAGYPAVVGDLGSEIGRRTTALARSSANTSPEARAALEGVTQDRFEEQSGRASDFLRGLVRTPANATMTRDALEAAAQTARKPFYDRFHADSSGGVLSPRLEALANSGSPAMAAALKAAKANIADKTAAGWTFGPLSANGRPTGEYWDQVKRALDSSYKVAKRAGDDEQAAVVDTLRKSLVSEVDRLVPSYRDARGVAASFFKANDALDAGEKAVGSNAIGNADIAKGLGKMTPEERTLFREGFVSAYIDKVSRTSDARNIVKVIAANPDARKRLAIVLGRDGADRLQTYLRVEGVMDRLRKELGNSTTVRQWIEAGFAGGIGAGVNPVDPSTWSNAPQAVLYTLFLQGARKGALRIDQRVAERVGKLLASSDPAEFERAIALLSKNNTLKAAFNIVENSVYRGLTPGAIDRGRVSGSDNERQ